MSATERVRELLDERGVGWWNQTDPEPQTVTMARLGEQLIEYHENVNGTMGYHVWNMCDLTPEQAIAAALGDVPRLPHFWTHDGTLHVELPKLPESISVRLPDQRDREVGSARVWQYTRDSGTCYDKNGFDQDTGFECTVCGAMVDRYMITPDDTGHEVQFHYCPFCGREVDA